MRNAISQSSSLPHYRVRKCQDADSSHKRGRGRVPRKTIRSSSDDQNGPSCTCYESYQVLATLKGVSLAVLPNPLHKRRMQVMSLTQLRFPACPSSMTLEDSDRALIVETLERFGWIVRVPRGAAARLGLKRTTLLAKMRRMGILRPILQEGTDGSGIAPETT